MRVDLIVFNQIPVQFDTVSRFSILETIKRFNRNVVRYRADLRQPGELSALLKNSHHQNFLSDFRMGGLLIDGQYLDGHYYGHFG